MWIRFETVFRTIISVNQLSIYGAVSDLCEEYGSCQTRTERPVLAGQFDPLFEPANLLITTPAISSEIPATRVGIQIHPKLPFDAYENRGRRSNKNGATRRWKRDHQGTKVEEHDIDFRVPGLSHAVVKEAEHLGVQELVKKIGSHLHREAIHADLQQNNVYNPLSKIRKR